MRRTLHRGYVLAALLIFGVEVAIALWLNDSLVRPYGGDLLAVVLIYVSLRAIHAGRAWRQAALAFAIGCAVELGQALQLVRRLGLEDNAIARTVIGTSFAWGDVLAYALGALLSVLLSAFVERAPRTAATAPPRADSS